MMVFTYGSKALSLAIQSGNLLLVKKLIAQGITLEKGSCWETTERDSRLTAISCWLSEAFVNAVKYHHFNLAHFFHSLGADIKAYNLKGFSALYFAIKNDDVTTVKWLIEQGCSLDDYVAESVGYCFDGEPQDLKKPIPLEYKFLLAYHDLEGLPPFMGDDKLFDLLLSETLRLTQRETFRIPLGVLNNNQMRLAAEKLHSHPFIKAIHFNFVDYNQLQQREIIAYILLNSDLLTKVELNFYDSRYDYNDMQEMKNYLISDIAKLLRNNHNLKKLYLWHTPTELLSTDITPLLKALENNQTLLELNFYASLQYNDCDDDYVGLADDNFMPITKQLEPYLHRNRKLEAAQSLAERTNIIRNMDKDNLSLALNLSQPATTIASLQGYCTFFARKLGITAKRNQQQQWQAYYNNEALLLSPILAEAIVTKEHEKILIYQTMNNRE